MRNSPQRCTGVRQFGRTNRSFVNGRHCTSIESRADTPCEFASRDSLPGSGDQRGAHQGGAQRPQHEEPAREADHPAPRNGRSATSGRAGGHPPETESSTAATISATPTRVVVSSPTNEPIHPRSWRSRNILMLSPNVPFELRTDRLDASWQTPQLSTDDLELHAAVGEHLP